MCVCMYVYVCVWTADVYARLRVEVSLGPSKGCSFQRGLSRMCGMDGILRSKRQGRALQEQQQQQQQEQDRFDSFHFHY